MKTIFGYSLTAAFLFIAATGTAASPTSTNSQRTRLKIAVHILDYAHLEPGILQQATTTTTRIFREAGVETVFVNKYGNMSHHLSLQTLPRLCNLYAYIFPREKADKVGLPKAALGVTFLQKDIMHFYISEQVLKDIAVEWKEKDQALLLGHALAHEMGHALGLESHSQAGIMLERWDHSTLLAMLNGALGFSPNEAGRLRSEIVRRSRQKAIAVVAAATQNNPKVP